MLVPNHEQALQQIVALKKEVSELRAKLASQEEDYHKSEGEMHAEVTDGVLRLRFLLTSY